MPEEVWDKDASKAIFDSEIEKAREYLSEKKKITPKPEEFRQTTTLPDNVERVILSDLRVKEELIETLASFSNEGEWAADIQRLAREAGGLRLMLEAHKIKE